MNDDAPVNLSEMRFHIPGMNHFHKVILQSVESS